MSNWGTLVKSQCPHKYGPLNVATAADSGLGVGLSSSIVCGCAPGPGSRDTDTGCCHSQHFYRLIASVRWVVRWPHSTTHQQIIALWSWALQHEANTSFGSYLVIFKWPIHHAPFNFAFLYISNDFFFCSVACRRTVGVAAWPPTWQWRDKISKVKFKWNIPRIISNPKYGSVWAGLGCHCVTVAHNLAVYGDKPKYSHPLHSPRKVSSRYFAHMMA